MNIKGVELTTEQLTAIQVVIDRNTGPIPQEEFERRCMIAMKRAECPLATHYEQFIGRLER